MAKFFGQYLLEKGVLSREQLLEALTKQREKVQKIGELAVRKGYLKPIDVETIQREQQKRDLYFGEAAVRLNLLTETQVKELLNIQKANHVYLGDVIVDLKFLPRKSVDEELKKFLEEESEGGISGEIKIPSSCLHPELLHTAADLSVKHFRRFSSLPVKISSILESRILENFQILTLINVSGDFKGVLSLSCSKEVVDHINRNFGGVNLKEVAGNSAEDVVSEFFNIFCGNLMLKWLEVGKACEISVPYSFIKTKQKDLKVGNGYRIFILDLESTEGKISFGFIPDFTLQNPA
jgi:CheY-specific phosphatase CheX